MKAFLAKFLFIAFTVLCAPALAAAQSNLPTTFKDVAIDVSLSRTRPNPGEIVEVTVQVNQGDYSSTNPVQAVLLEPSRGKKELVLQRFAGRQQTWTTAIPLGPQASEGIYVIHVWTGEATNPSAVGKATFLLGQIVADFFVAPYLDEKQPTQDLENYLKEFGQIGGNFLIAHNLITPAKVYFPSKLTSANVPRSADDIVDLVLSRADKLGYAVLISVSWDMTRQSPYKSRMDEIKKITAELYALYRHHPSFAGFYSYQEGSGTYFVPYVREFTQQVKSIYPHLLTACAPHMDDPLLAGYLSTVEELDILIYQTGVMASYRTDNRKKYPFRRVKDFCSLAAGAKRLQNKISINHVELFGYLENRLNPNTAATTYENIYRQILSAATVTDADGISFFTYQAHVHVPLKQFKEVSRSRAAVADGLKAFKLITSRVSRQPNHLTVYFPYSDWIVERWPNYFLPALDAFRVLGVPVDVLPYAPPLEESVYPYYPFHLNPDVLTRLLREQTVLILPNVSGFQQTDSDLIKSFVEQGGVVMAFGPQIPMGRTYERKDLFGIDEASGRSIPTAIVVKQAVGDRVKTGNRLGFPRVGLTAWATTNTAQVIARFDDDSPAIVANRFGKGMVVSILTDAWTASQHFPELVRDVIDYALAPSGNLLPVDIVGVNENIDVAVGKTTNGFTTAIVNHGADKLDLVLRTNRSKSGTWFDLVASNTLESVTSERSLKLTVPANGFRAVEFR